MRSSTGYYSLLRAINYVSFSACKCEVPTVRVGLQFLRAKSVRRLQDILILHFRAHRIAAAVCAMGAALCVLAMVLVLRLGVADDLKISQGIVLEEGGIDPKAMTAITDDVFVIAGQSEWGESAVGFRLSKDASKAELLWRYIHERPLADPMAGLRFATAADTPDFRGVAAMPDGSVFLCGSRPGGGRGKDRPSLLTHLESSGRVIGEKVLIPPKFVDPLWDHPVDPNNLGEVVLSEFDECVPWGDNVGIVGRAVHFFPSQENPRNREYRSYYWIMVVNAAGEIVWQKIIPFPFKLTSIDEFTSVLITPQRNLQVTRYALGQSEIVSVSETGELIAARQLEGYYIAVHPIAAATSIQLFGGDPNGTKNLVTVGENLQELHREDGLNLPEFVAEKAYGRADSSLLLIGQQTQGAGYVSAIRNIAPSRQVTGKTLTHGSLFDAGAAKVSTQTKRSGELLIARTQLERTPSGAKRLGIALDMIGTPTN
jgi:hypothetical protein